MSVSLLVSLLTIFAVRSAGEEVSVLVDPAAETPGTLTSPGYPDHYDNNITVTWTLTAPEGMAVAVTIEAFALQYHYLCIYDYLRFDGIKHCHDWIAGYQLVSSGNVATVVFHSDGSVTDTGFSATYTAVPAPAACPDAFSRVGASCYWTEYGYTWSEAQEACSARGASMAVYSEWEELMVALDWVAQQAGGM